MAKGRRGDAKRGGARAKPASDDARAAAATPIQFDDEFAERVKRAEPEPQPPPEPPPQPQPPPEPPPQPQPQPREHSLPRASASPVPAPAPVADDAAEVAPDPDPEAEDDPQADDAPDPDPDPDPPAPPLDLRAPLLAAAFAFAVDLPRLAPTVTVLGDSAVFVSSAATLGVPQPPGYPLYVFLGHLFSKLPIGEIAYRLHLMSAVCHAVTVGLVAAIAMRLGAGRAAAIGGALALAFSQAFFQGSHYAEVFPLNDFFTALLLERAVAFWRAGPDRPLPERRRDLVVFGALVGVASAHHQMIVLTAPTLALLLYAGGALPALRGRTSFAGLGAFLAPLLGAYALLLRVASRQPFSSWGDIHDVDSAWTLATRHDYGGLFSPHIEKNALDASELASAWGEGVARHFGWVLVGVALFGLVATLRRDGAPLWRGEGVSALVPDARRRVTGLALLLLVGAAGPLFAIANKMQVGEEHGLAFAERFSTMSEVPVGVLVALGLHELVRVARAYVDLPVLRLAAGLAFLPPLLTHAGTVDLHDDRRGLALAHDLVDSTPDGAIVLITGDASNGAILYACGVERRCGDRRIFSPGQLHMDWRVAQLRRRWPDLAIPDRPSGKPIHPRDLVVANLGRRPIYVAPQLLDLDAGLRELQLLPEGLLVHMLAPAPGGAAGAGEAAEAAIAAEKETFFRSARGLASSTRCEGCGMRRSALRWPSLETQLPSLYALAMLNHARMLTAWAQAAEVPTPEQEEMLRLAEVLQSRAVEIDEETVKRVR
jgi:hypothetical protein